MDLKKLTLTAVFVPIFSFNSSAQTFSCLSHETLTPIGITLSGKEISECVINLSESDKFENAFGMSRSERTYPNTDDFNCHGLAYYNRNGWINLPNHLLYQAITKGWYYTSLTKAKKGDRGSLFVQDDTKGNFTINGKKFYISHSWIFNEDYINDNSKVRSKYGKMGEYVHSYSKMLPVYKQTNDDFVLVLPFSLAQSPQQAIDQLMKSADLSKSNFHIYIEDIPNNIEFSQNNVQLDYYKYQAYTTIEIINSLEVIDFIGIAAASSDLSRYGAIKKNAKLIELYNRHQNGEDIISQLLKSSSNSEFKKLILEFTLLLN